MARAEECACGNVSGTNPECERCELIRENKRLALLCSMDVLVLEDLANVLYVNEVPRIASTLDNQIQAVELVLQMFGVLIPAFRQIGYDKAVCLCSELEEACDAAVTTLHNAAELKRCLEAITR